VSESVALETPSIHSAAAEADESNEGYHVGAWCLLSGVAIPAWPFRGREAELALIAQAMDDPAVAGIVVAGEAGVGKTRLALEALGQAA
jgi:predicted ribonuclease YlaK